MTYPGDPNPATADISCDSTSVPTLPVTQLQDADGNEIEHHTQVDESTAIGDSVVINGATVDASGSLTYNVYKGLSCSGTPVHTEKVIVENGAVPDATPWVPDSGPGWYTWQVKYSGDDNNAGSRAECKVEAVFVGKVQPVLTTTMMNDDTNSVIPQNDEVPTGTTVSDTATLVPHSTDIDGNNNLTGTITYTLVE